MTRPCEVVNYTCQACSQPITGWRGYIMLRCTKVFQGTLALPPVILQASPGHNTLVQRVRNQPIAGRCGYRRHGLPARAATGRTYQWSIYAVVY